MGWRDIGLGGQARKHAFSSRKADISSGWSSQICDKAEHGRQASGFAVLDSLRLLYIP
jgi:hypothetical protein